MVFTFLSLPIGTQCSYTQFVYLDLNNFKLVSFIQSTSAFNVVD